MLLLPNVGDLSTWRRVNYVAFDKLRMNGPFHYSAKPAHAELVEAQALTLE
jgi:hypothetical protein